jgi:hypothetical protein
MQAYEQDKAREAAENAKLGSIRDRLMSRTNLMVIDVPFKDEQGEFTFKCRVFTIKEQNIIFQILEEFATLTAMRKDKNADAKQIQERYQKGLETTKTLIAYPDGVCLNPELTLEFWNGGNYTSDLPFYIIRYIMDNQAAAVQEAALFRPK